MYHTTDGSNVQIAGAVNDDDAARIQRVTNYQNAILDDSIQRAIALADRVEQRLDETIGGSSGVPAAAPKAKAKSRILMDDDGSAR